MDFGRRCGVDSSRTRHCGGLQQRFSCIECTGLVARHAFGLSNSFRWCIRIPLGWNDLEVQSSIGVGVEWKTSETIVSQLVQTEGQDHIVQAYQGRTRYVTMPVIGEIGIQRRATRKQPGWYLGWHWSSPIGRSAWAGKHVVLGFHSWDCAQFSEFRPLVLTFGWSCLNDHNKAHRGGLCLFSVREQLSHGLGHEVEVDSEGVVNEIVA